MRMTAESGETLCACRSTSMPSMFGILMSVMMTSYRAPSILFLAVCPACTVSTRCPSRRKEMSSISQMERSSSQTRMLATRASSRRQRYRLRGMLIRGVLGLRGDGFLKGRGAVGIELAQSQNKCRSLPRLGSRPDLAFMRLHDLINNGQPKPGAALKIRLEGLENLLDLLRCHSGSGIREGDLPVLSQGFNCGG